MAQLIYQDQSANELRLNLVQGAVDKEKLTVLCTGKIDLPMRQVGQLEAGIIGASHYWEIKGSNGMVKLTEVFACVDCVEPKEESRVLTVDLHDAKCVKKQFDDLNYQFTSQKTDWASGENEFCRLMSSARSNLTTCQIGLVYVFPKGENAEFAPTTLVCACIDLHKESLDIRTVHAYPNEDTLIFTNTIVKGGGT